MITDNYPEKGKLKLSNPEQQKEFDQVDLIGWDLSTDSEGRVRPTILMFGPDDEPTKACQLSVQDACELGMYMFVHAKAVAEFELNYGDSESKVLLKAYIKQLDTDINRMFGDGSAVKAAARREALAELNHELKEQRKAHQYALKGAEAAGVAKEFKRLAPKILQLGEAAGSDSAFRKESVLGNSEIQKLIKAAVEV